MSILGSIRNIQAYLFNYILSSCYNLNINIALADKSHKTVITGNDVDKKFS